MDTAETTFCKSWAHVGLGAVPVRPVPIDFKWALSRPGPSLISGHQWATWDNVHIGPPLPQGLLPKRD